jgi:hypothetical protein
MDSVTNARISALVGAFSNDGFVVDKNKDVFDHQGKIGIVATHKSASIGRTGKYKKAYYVEGSPHSMGYLMGLMAEPTISRMCTQFAKTCLTAFINISSPPELVNILGTILDDVANELSKPIYSAVPDQYKEELEGILDGCKQSNSATPVTMDALWVLNVGFDALLAFVYTFKLPFKKTFPIELEHKHFRIPMMCNGFSVFGTDQNNEPYHYMGRDFMFPTGGVFQDTATKVIYNPDKGIPLVSLSAPGIIGSITAMNRNGVGIGVQMSPAGNCNSAQPGLNSLLLNRHVIQNAKNMQEVIQIMAESQRGVSWIYIVGDGTDGKDQACVIEAGEKVDQIDFLSYPPTSLSEGVLLPVKNMLNYLSTGDLGGLMVRMHNYQYPYNYQIFNSPLINDFDANYLAYLYDVKLEYSYIYNSADFSMNGFIDASWTDRNCPMAHYFAPIRHNPGNFVIATNHFLIPEMRLCAMNPASDFIAQEHWDDIQWRYDELSSLMNEALKNNVMTKDKAKEIIDFLSPSRSFKEYYNKNNDDLHDVTVQGALSLLDLKNLTIESRYGYYSDEWVKISLKNFF